MMWMETEIDKAFDWLVLILAVIAAALCQFPELYPLRPYEIAGLTLVRVLVFPIVVLATVWVWSHLARKMEYKIILKSFAWIYASFILTADIMLLGGTVIPLRRAAAQPSPLAPGSPLQIIVSLLFLFSPPIVVPILFCFFIIRPRFRELYKDSKFLYSLPRQALLYILALATYVLSIGVLEGAL